tara:strand:+ start:1417 stop:1602 length:186 start_codon:yes stop_codon:yes gene_type:complete
MIKRYIRGQVRRHGAKAVIMWVLENIAKMTPSKKDDEMIAKVKAVLEPSTTKKASPKKEKK